MRENPHAVIDLEGLQHEVGNVSVLQSVQRNGLKTISHLHTDRDVCKWSTDTHRGATFRIGKTPKLGNGFPQNRPGREG